jgi:hypothetical protein
LLLLVVGSGTSDIVVFHLLLGVAIGALFFVALRVVVTFVVALGGRRLETRIGLLLL